MSIVSIQGIVMRFSRPFCLIRPDFKAKLYKDYDYLYEPDTGSVAASFTTRKKRDVLCSYNLFTGNGYKRVREPGFIVETSFRNHKVKESTITTMLGSITKDFETGFISILSHDYKIEHGITKDGQIVDMNIEKMYKFWQKFGFYKMPTMEKLKEVMKKIKTCRRIS